VDEGERKKLPANKSVLHFLSRNLNIKLASRCENAALAGKKEEKKEKGRKQQRERERENFANSLYIFQLRRYIEFKRIP